MKDFWKKKGWLIMVNSIKKSQVEKIIQYVKENDAFDKVVIFGDAITDRVNKNTYIDVAVRTTHEDDATNEEVLFDVLSAIDSATDGRFNFVVMNDPDLTSNTLHEIERGEVVYERKC